MNTQLVQRQVSDTYIMLNFEITFQGIHRWLALAGYVMDDATLFRSLFNPEAIDPEKQTELLYTILHRYEDVFFQMNTYLLNDNSIESHSPIHQLLLRMMNHRTLHGEDDALLDLYLLIQEDCKAEQAIYPSLHHLFDVN